VSARPPEQSGEPKPGQGLCPVQTGYMGDSLDR
jgi:hypothetical protein